MALNINAPNAQFSNRDGALVLGNNFQSYNGDIVIGNVINIGSDDDQVVNSLPVARGAAYHSHDFGHDGLCLDGTRVAVLNQITSWAEARDSCHVYWLNGLAGTGKSAIARTMARRLAAKQRLGASFFFRRRNGDLAHGRKFVTTIAAELASVAPAMKKRVAAAVRATREAGAMTLLDQWTRLVRGPVAEYSSDPRRRLFRKRLVVVVDALDECDDERDLGDILGLMLTVARDKNPHLRVLLTSRPETPIQFGFQSMPEARRKHFVLHHVDRHDVDQDLRLYFRVNLRRVGSELLGDHGWPDDETLGRLVQLAGGLFIWAATAYYHIRQGGAFARRRLQDVLVDGGLEVVREKGLDRIYATVLGQAVRGDYSEDEDQELYRDLMGVVGTIAVLRSPLDRLSLSSLSTVEPSDVDRVLPGLHSILDMPDELHGPIQLHHASFRDFVLASPSRYGMRYTVDPKLQHKSVAENSLRIMSQSLRRDMCDLSVPGARIADIDRRLVEQQLSPALQYACSHWVGHFHDAQAAHADFVSILAFLQKHLLHWLEALCLLERSPEAVIMLNQLESMASAEYAKLQEFAYDAKRFVLANRATMGEAPLQTYYSALVFAPSQSLVRQNFLDQMPQWICRLPEISGQWSEVLQTLETPESKLEVAFSPDSQLLAIAGGFRVRLFDPITGAVRGVLHDNFGETLVFSPSGRQLVYRCGDDVLGLVDVKLKATRAQFYCKYDSPQIAFSPDERLLAITDGTSVKLFDTDSAAVRRHVKVEAAVSGVAFSPDGQLVAYATANRIVLWDYLKETIVAHLRGHTSNVACLTFSPSGRLLASGSRDKLIRLWDVKQGVRARYLVHPSSVLSVVFSRDGHLLASGGPGTCLIWEVETGTLRHTLNTGEGYLAPVFSPDGRLLATGLSRTYDYTQVKRYTGMDGFWDTTTGDLVSALRYKSALGQHTIDFSPDGQLIASASDSGWSLIHDVKLLSTKAISDSDLRTVKRALLSPCCRRVACHMSDNTLRLTESETNMSRIDYPVHEVGDGLQFSPDGRLLAFLSPGSNSPNLLAIESGEIFTSDGFATREMMVFSPSSKVLAWTEWTSVRLWEYQTGDIRHVTITAPSIWIDALAVSHDDALFAVALSKKIAVGRISGGLLFSNDFSDIISMAFAPDDRFLAVSRHGLLLNEVFLWNWRSGTIVHSMPVWGVGELKGLSFSADGQRLRTDRGTIAVYGSLSAPDASGATAPHAAARLIVGRKWISYAACDLLSLPPDYKYAEPSVNENTVALVDSKGRLIVFEVDPSKLDLDWLTRNTPRWGTWREPPSKPWWR